MITLMISFGWIPIFIITWLLINSKSAILIFIISVIISLAFHGVAYLLGGAERSEILMWARISVPILALISNAIISFVFIVFSLVKNRKKLKD